MKKIIKKKKIGLLGQKVNFIYDPKLDNWKPGPFELKKLEEANRSLARMKSLPK
jgi:hypothetical protein